MDPSIALAALLIATAFLLDGFFVAGASTFGPMRTLDVGVTDYPDDPDETFFWHEGDWIETKLPKRMSAEEYKTFLSWAGDLELTNHLNAYPGRIQISMWDRQVYWVTMKNWTPPTTIGEPPPRFTIRPFLELYFGVVILILSFTIWRAGVRRGIRYRVYDPARKVLGL